MAGEVVIVGAGQAGAQAAASLRSEGFDGPVTLVGEEPHLPYQRPPLSKALLLGKQEAEATIWRPAAFYDTNRIALRLGERVSEIDRAGRCVRLAGGAALPYAHLILATGTQPRRLTLPGAELPNVLYLRTLADAAALGAALTRARDAVVIGGGFIGLEVAASARQLGIGVTVLEAQPRLMARSVSRMTSAAFRSLHERMGVEIHLDTAVSAMEEADGRLAVITRAGRLACDLVLVGIGAVAQDQLAAKAGLETANGILVDACGRTADPTIYAVGDCAAVADPVSGKRLRLESVQNALDQGRAIARLILGRAAGDAPVPWFWSDQYDSKLQIAGVADGDAELEIARGEPHARSFSVFRYTGGKLAAVDSIDAPGDHMLARRLLAAGSSPGPEVVRDQMFDLRSLIQPAPP